MSFKVYPSTTERLAAIIRRDKILSKRTRRTEELLERTTEKLQEVKKAANKPIQPAEVKYY